MTEEDTDRQRIRKNTTLFTDLGIRRLNTRKRLDEVNRERAQLGLKPVTQDVIWDTGQKGLALLIGPSSKTFRVQFKLNGKWVQAKIGRFPELVSGDDAHKENAQVTEAHRIAADWRAKARQGIDPRPESARRAERLAEPPAPSGPSYGEVVDRYITLYAKPRQRTWYQTQRILMRTCRAWLDKPIRDITKTDAYDLLDPIVAAGRHYKAAVTLAWLRSLWRFAFKRDYVTAPVMDTVEIEITRRKRDRFYTDDEIKAVWNAADQLDPIESAYMKLVILLAPRKTALACMEWSQLDDPDNPTLWTTPFELTKSRKSTHPDRQRRYYTPLPLLARRIIKSLPRRDDELRVFPSLPLRYTPAGRPVFPGQDLIKRLIEHGAPKDFRYHTARHTMATWFENHGRSEWERGLLLNHSSTSVTGGYSHGYPMELKDAMLDEWADHVAELLQPEGATLR